MRTYVRYGRGAGSSVHRRWQAAVWPATVGEVLGTRLPSGLKPLLVIISKLGQVDYWRGACSRAEQGHKLESGDPEQGQECAHFRVLGPSRKGGGGWLQVRCAICPYDDGWTTSRSSTY